MAMKLTCPICKKRNSVEDYDGLMHPDHMCSECDLKQWITLGKHIDNIQR